MPIKVNSPNQQQSRAAGPPAYYVYAHTSVHVYNILNINIQKYWGCFNFTTIRSQVPLTTCSIAAIKLLDNM